MLLVISQGFFVLSTVLLGFSINSVMLWCFTIPAERFPDFLECFCCFPTLLGESYDASKPPNSCQDLLKAPHSLCRASPKLLDSCYVLLQLI
jgi:hypothetical protein